MGRGSNGSLLVAEDAEAYATMVSELRQNLDTMFLLVMGAIICFLQSGFGMLEAGSVRQKNVSNILSKNFADLCLGVTFFGAIGYGLAFGKGNQWVGPAPGLHPQVGLEHFGGSGLSGDLLPHAFMQSTFAATCSTIVSGAVAERSDYIGYLVFRCLPAPPHPPQRSRYRSLLPDPGGSPVTCHLSPVTCHLSTVTWHLAPECRCTGPGPLRAGWQWRASLTLPAAG